MSGEAKSYRMNAPMKWGEFREMPDDLKIAYIKAIREKYRVSDTAIADMFGVSRMTTYKWFKTLGILPAKKGRVENEDKEGFLAWVNGIPVKKEDSEEQTSEETVEEVIEEPVEEEPPTEKETVVPRFGCMTFECAAEDALNTVASVLGRAFVRIRIEWGDEW